MSGTRDEEIRRRCSEVLEPTMATYDAVSVNAGRI